MGMIQIDPASFLRSVKSMSHAQIGMYVTILSLLAEGDGSIDADAGKVSRAIGTNRVHAAPTIETLLACGLLVETEGRLRSPLVDDQREKLEKRSKMAAEKASRRWAGGQDVCHGNATAMPQHSHSTEFSLKTQEKSEKPETKKFSTRKNGTRLPADWVLTRRLGNLALELGLTDAEVRFEAGAFKDYWISKPGAAGTKLDWEATWRNWCRTVLKNRPKQRPLSGGPAPAPQAATLDEWGKRMKVFAKMGANGGWHPSWGPKPGEIGCLVPEELLNASRSAA